MARQHFKPVYTITPEIADGLMRIAAVKGEIETLPITPRVLASLRESARLISIHNSTKIEGNLLTQEEVARVIGEQEHFPGRERDENEVRGYYAALDAVEQLAKTNEPVSQTNIKNIHGRVMSGGKGRVKPTPYRDGQNVIQVSGGRRIVYLPPEANDVPALMESLVAWINLKDDLPVPLKAAVAHLQFATIHPYYDGNGRTARLLTNLILHLGGYGLKGLYALEEYYAEDLGSYYRALAVGPSHNYYLGRAKADMTGWIAFFVGGMAASFEKVRVQAREESAAGALDQAELLRDLDSKQRKALTLFRRTRRVTAKDMAALFGFQPRSAAALCRRWVAEGFFVVASPSKKVRSYRLGDPYDKTVRSSVDR